MAKKMLVRVDDRLIHGQVCTQWVGVVNADRIIVIDDEVSKDKMRQSILKFAAPEGMRVSFFSAERAVEVWNKNKFGAHNVLVLFRDVHMIKKCKDLGLVFPEVSLGQMSITGDRKQIHRQFGLNLDEAQLLLDLERDGQVIYFQMISTDGKESLDIVRRAFPDAA